MCVGTGPGKSASRSLPGSRDHGQSCMYPQHVVFLIPGSHREPFGVVLGKVDDGVSSEEVNGKVRDVVWGIQTLLRRSTAS